jgi:F0F1-type ATP synthase assembly protein I
MSELKHPPEREKPEDEDQRQRAEWNRLSQLGFEFVAYIGVLGYGGWKLDQRYGWNGRGLLGGLLLGMVAWIYRFLRQTWHMFK